MRTDPSRFFLLPYPAWWSRVNFCGGCSSGEEPCARHHCFSIIPSISQATSLILFSLFFSSPPPLLFRVHSIERNNNKSLSRLRALLVMRWRCKIATIACRWWTRELSRRRRERKKRIMFFSSSSSLFLAVSDGSSFRFLASWCILCRREEWWYDSRGNSQHSRLQLGAMLIVFRLSSDDATALTTRFKIRLSSITLLVQCTCKKTKQREALKCCNAAQFRIMFISVKNAEEHVSLENASTDMAIWALTEAVVFLSYLHASPLSVHKEM